MSTVNTSDIQLLQIAVGGKCSTEDIKSALIAAGGDKVKARGILRGGMAAAASAMESDGDHEPTVPKQG